MGKSYKDQNKFNKKVSRRQSDDDEFFTDHIPSQKKKEHRTSRRDNDRYVKNIIKNGYSDPEEED